MLEQHPVPQNVTSFQFKLIGDMTLKQFGYLAGGFILAYVSYNLPLPFFFGYPLVAVFALGGIGFAFVPIEQRPMDVWFMSFVRSVYSPTQYIWQKESQQTVVAPSTTKAGINKIPSLHIPVLENLINKLFPIPAAKTNSLPTPTVSQTAPSAVSSTQPVPVTQPAKTTPPQPSLANTESITSVSPTQPAPTTQPAKTTPPQPPVANTGSVIPVSSVQNPSAVIRPQKATPSPQTPLTNTQPIKAVPTVSHSSTDLKHMPTTPPAALQKKHTFPHLSLPHISFMTHTKKQKHVAPLPKPQIAQPAYAPAIFPSVVTNAPLPSISGIRVTDDQQKSNTTKQQESPPVPRQEVVIEPDNKDREPSKEYLELEKKLKNLEKQLFEERQQKQEYQKVQQQLVNTLTDKQQLEKEINELKTKNAQQTQPPQPPPTQQRQAPNMQQQEEPTISVITPQVAKSVGIPKITNFPNVVSGIVREKNGNLLVGILVTVKDKEDIPVRALKTNKLGQFAASTPLPNGEYILETEDPKQQFVFDLARVVLNGSVVPPIELIAKSKQDLDRNKLEKSLFGTTQ